MRKKLISHLILRIIVLILATTYAILAFVVFDRMLTAFLGGMWLVHSMDKLTDTIKQMIDLSNNKEIAE